MTDQQDKILDWITRSGRSLEMLVAAQFQEAGFFVNQAYFFEDPQTGAARESDVHAQLMSLEGDSLAILDVACECKASPGHPWVLLSATANQRTQGVFGRPTNGPGRKILTKLARQPEIRALPLFGPSSPLGYAIVTASLSEKGKAPRDLAYEATCSVAKAAASLLKQTAEEFASFVWPLVVLKGQLFQATMDADHRISVSAIDHGTLAWRNPMVGGNSLITIATESALPTIINAASASWAAFSSAAIAAIAEGGVPT